MDLNNESTAGADVSVEVPKLHNINLLIDHYTHSLSFPGFCMQVKLKMFIMIKLAISSFMLCSFGTSIEA